MEFYIRLIYKLSGVEISLPLKSSYYKQKLMQKRLIYDRIEDKKENVFTVFSIRRRYIMATIQWLV